MMIYSDTTGLCKLLLGYLVVFANAGNSQYAAISSLNCPPIVALELCREHLVGPLKVMCATFDFKCEHSCGCG